jgi:hypothetical protein
MRKRLALAAVSLVLLAACGEQEARPIRIETLDTNWTTQHDPQTGLAFRCLSGYVHGYNGGGPMLWCYQIELGG